MEFGDLAFGIVLPGDIVEGYFRRGFPFDLGRTTAEKIIEIAAAS